MNYDILKLLESDARLTPSQLHVDHGGYRLLLGLFPVYNGLVAQDGAVGFVFL